ncbi:MAG: hypothetical protein M9894_35180 [Planctomycetes bacterium]|nr:hypothetical protein [Planctomycetota bacterium]
MRSRPIALAGPATLGFALAGVAALLAHLRHTPVLGTDALLYHLPMAVWWLQAGWLTPVDLPFHGGGIEHGPALSQTLQLLLLRLAGDDGLVWLLQPACLLLLVVVFLRSARLVGASRPVAAGLGGLLALCPPFFVNAQLQQADLLLCLGGALALHGALCLRRRPAPGLVLVGLGLGVALATKGTATLTAAALAPFVVAGLAPHLRDPARRRRLLGPGLAGLTLLVLGSGFLLRTWALHGNPLWPGRVRVLGVTLFEGLYDFSGFLDHGWSPGAMAAILVDGPEQHALAPPWSLLLWLGWAAACAGLALRPVGWRRGPGRALLPLGFPLLNFVLLFGLVPGAWEEPRYHLGTFYGLWLAAARGAACVARVDRRAAGAALGLVAPAFLALELTTAGAWFEGWVALAALGAAAAAALAWRPTAQARARRSAATTLLAVGAVAALSAPAWYPGYRAARDAARDRQRAAVWGPHGEAWARLDALGQERPLVVAYAGTPLVYPLFGPRLDNRVVYLRLSPDDREAPLVFGRPPRPPGIHVMPLRVAEQRRARVDDARWLAQLDAERVDVLVLADVPLRGGADPERGLVARHPSRFRPLWEGDGVTLLEVHRD